MNPIVRNIMALATDLAYCTDDEFGEIKVALRAAIEQALGPGEPVAEIYRRQLEAIAVGDSTDPVKDAGELLVETGFWHSIPDTTPQPQPNREHDLKDVRCECCGYMTYHREHMGCIRAAAPQPQPKQEPLSKKWRGGLHESFFDVADFDDEGIPWFYSKESSDRFQRGKLSAPCKGKNCGSLNGWLHSDECRTEHEAQYTTRPAAPDMPHPQPKQEPVKLPCCSYHAATAIKWNQFNGVVQCHNCGEIYAPQPRREWVGLDDADLANCDTEEYGAARYWEAKLREKNGGGV
jgi:hypothetical protein